MDDRQRQVLRSAENALSNGDLAGAERLCRQLITSPIKPEVQLFLSLVKARKGDFNGAINELKSLLARHPQDAEAHSALSTLLLRQQKKAEGILHGNRAVEIAPHSAANYASFARDLFLSELVEDAKNVLELALSTNSSNEPFLKELVERMKRCDRTSEVIAALARAASSNRETLELWLVLGHLQSISGAIQPALESARHAVRLDPNSIAGHLLCGDTYSRLGDDLAAITAYKKVVEIDPQNVPALTAVGVLLEREGDFRGAASYLDRSIAIRPDNGFAQYMRLNKSEPGVMTVTEIERLEKVSSDCATTLVDRSYLWRAVGREWERRGEYQRAMRAYDLAGKAGYDYWSKRKPWNRDAEEKFFELLLSYFTANRISELQRAALNQQSPVLIVGMPRSGTTLVDQVLTGHPEIGGVGELEFWFAHAVDLLREGARSQLGANLRQIATKYWGILERGAPGKGFITDKMPQNYTILGLFCAAFPNGRVIHVQRNPLDTCLSIYTTPFSNEAIFTHRKEDIASAYRQYQQLMAGWRTSLSPRQLYEVSYEQLVLDPAVTVQGLLSFLGLPWNESCLAPESNKRRVETASLWQVRQPIYKTSINRWKNFEPWLGELASLL